MSTRLQHLCKATQRKLDRIQEVRLRLARFLREQRLAKKAASEYVAWENGK